VLFPNLRDTEEAAVRDNEDAIRELPKFRAQVAQAQARIDRFEWEELTSIRQLPDLEGESLEFMWDIANLEGETYQIIRLGDVELWRELAFWDNIPQVRGDQGIPEEEIRQQIQSPETQLMLVQSGYAGTTRENCSGWNTHGATFPQGLGLPADSVCHNAKQRRKRPVHH
jgi:hypothetical protein